VEHALLNVPAQRRMVTVSAMVIVSLGVLDLRLVTVLLMVLMKAANALNVRCSKLILGKWMGRLV
jgi:hypothetical protein